MFLLFSPAFRLVLGPADLLPGARLAVLHQRGAAHLHTHVHRVLAVLDETFLDIVLLAFLLLHTAVSSAGENNAVNLKRHSICPSAPLARYHSVKANAISYCSK